MEDRNPQEIEKVLNEFTDKCALFLVNNNASQNVDLEQFIVKFLLSFELSYYEGIGILEEAKNVYRDIILNMSNNEVKEEKEEND